MATIVSTITTPNVPKAIISAITTNGVTIFTIYYYPKQGAGIYVFKGTDENEAYTIRVGHLMDLSS
jgi:hypothetical protein